MFPTQTAYVTLEIIFVSLPTPTPHQKEFP